MRKIKVLIGGSPYHAKRLAEEIISFNQSIEAKTEQPPWPDNKLRKVIPQLTNTDIYHGIYWDDCYKIFFAAKLLRKKTVCHWIGTDVFNVLRDKKRRLAIKILNKIIDVHLAGSPGLINELKEIGIDALWMPHIHAVVGGKVPPMPASPTVLSYLPDSRAEFYGASIVRQLADDFKDVKFIVVAGTGAGVVSPPNMTYLGYQKDMDKVYGNTTVLLRIVKHDGQALMVLEALARGRQVIWSEPFPHCHHARDFATAKAALSSIIRNPVINYSGVSYVQEEFNNNRVIGRLANIYVSLLQPATSSFDSSASSG